MLLNLFLDLDNGASLYGRVLTLPIAGHLSTNGIDSKITIRFSLLPITDWSDYPNAEKRSMGIVGGAGVSILRAKREIDYGWHFMAGKRKENYDDWWRCELEFAPELDEFMGVTNNKQAIRPTDKANEILGPIIGSIGRELNSKVRAIHESIKSKPRTESERRISKASKFLPLPSMTGQVSPEVGRCEERDLANDNFLSILDQDDGLMVLVNSGHPFTRRAFGNAPNSEFATENLKLLFFALAKAESLLDSNEKETAVKLRDLWGRVLATMTSVAV